MFVWVRVCTCICVCVHACMLARERYFLADCRCSGCRQINNQLCTGCHQGSLSGWPFLLLLHSLHFLPKQHQPQRGLTPGCFPQNILALTLNFTISYDTYVCVGGGHSFASPVTLCLSARMPKSIEKVKPQEKIVTHEILIIWRSVLLCLVKAFMASFIRLWHLLYTAVTFPQGIKSTFFSMLTQTNY